MDDLHKWEKVHQEITTGLGGSAAFMFRMAVPGGWVYMHVTLGQRTRRKDEIHKSMVFVPDPAHEGE